MKLGIFWKTFLFLLFAYIGLKLIRPPLPSMIVQIFMALAFVGALVYVSANAERWQEWLSPLEALVFEERARIARGIVMILIPLFLSLGVYSKLNPAIEPPASLRIIHPAPPTEISFRGKKMVLAGLSNPFRVSDTEKLKQYSQEGKKIYYQNCFYCHGDALDGKGHFAKAFNPLPANFVDAGTIAQLQESYVFWRIAKGGVGLPANAHPWNSSMPVWEKMLTEDEIWKVILWIYEGAGKHPRTWEKSE